MFVSKWSRSNYLRPREISRDGRATKIQTEWVHMYIVLVMFGKFFFESGNCRDHI